MTAEQNTTAWAVAAYAEVNPGCLTLVLYAVLVPSWDEAVELVKVQPGIGPDGEIGEATGLSPETVQRLGLRPGEVRML